MIRSRVVFPRLALRNRMQRNLHAPPTRAPRVLVVGGGPVGLAMGYLLDRVYGVPTRIVERQSQPTTHPQAHFLNLRTMEVLHSSMPAFHQQLLDQAAPSELWRDYIYTTGVGKTREFARIDQFGSSIPRPLQSKQQLLDALSSLSPTQFLHFPQNRFETMLSSFVEASGVHVERGMELVDLQLTDDAGNGARGSNGDHRRPRVRLRNVRTQQVEDATFDYVIGADGAHSLVRQLSGIDMAGARNLQSIVNVHFTSKTLSSAAREHPGMLYFVFNENVIGVLIAHDLNTGEWVFQIPFFPPQETIAQDFSVAQCQQIVKHLLPANTKIPDDDIAILSVGQWQMSARVAKQYDRDHKVFLVGDAAHQFPPAGGFGMNTGIQDAHNLAWKLAWTLQNDVESSQLPVDAKTLLRSYEKERQLVAKLNTQLSLRNVERTMKIPSALNVSHNNAKILTSVVNAAPVKFLPLALQRQAIQKIMALGKKPLALLDNTSSALGERMRRHVREIVAKRSSLGMLFYHFDIGFSYDATKWSARAKELMDEEPLNHSALFGVDNQKESGVYSQQFATGVRFPHLWCVADSHDDPQQQSRVSTTTLAELVRQRDGEADAAVKFVLVVDSTQWASLPPFSEETSDVWKHVAVVLLSSDAPVDLITTVSATGTTGPLLQLQLQVVDPASRALWKQFTEGHAAALVRPDGHIGALWRRGDKPVDATALVAAMQQAITH